MLVCVFFFYKNTFLLLGCLLCVQVDSGLRQGRSEEWLRSCFRCLTTQVLDVAVDQAIAVEDEGVTSSGITTLANSVNEAGSSNSNSSSSSSSSSSSNDAAKSPTSTTSSSSLSLEFVARHPQPSVACFARCFPFRGGSWDRLEMVHARRATSLLAAVAADARMKRSTGTSTTGNNSSSSSSSSSTISGSSIPSSSSSSSAVADMLAVTLANHRNPWEFADPGGKETVDGNSAEADSAREPANTTEESSAATGGLDGAALRHGVRRLALGATLPDAGGAAALLSSLATIGLPGGMGGDSASAACGDASSRNGDSSSSGGDGNEGSEGSATSFDDDMPGGRGERALQVLCNLLPERDGGLGPVLGAALLHEDAAVRRPAKQLLKRLQKCKSTAPATASLNLLFLGLLEEEDVDESV